MTRRPKKHGGGSGGSWQRTPSIRTKGRVRVAIVGRPNVGKSTLFNRLLGRRRAITLDQPGITRDPIVEPVEWDDIGLDLVDTGGLRGEADIVLADRVHEHTVRAIGVSDVLVVVFDAREGLSPQDRETVDLVMKSGLPAVYVANKGEGRQGEQAALEFCALGIDAPLVISAEHGQGISELRGEIGEIVEAILEKRATAAAVAAEAAETAKREATPRDAGEESADGDGDEAADDADEDAEYDADFEDGEFEDDDFEEDSVPRACRVALVGRPNVGKSSLLNLLAGEMLSLVDNRPGTTRDVVDTEIERGGRRYLLLDTAGMRRPSRVEEGIEWISVRRSLEAIERADVVMLLVEPEEGVTDQDARIARHAWEEGRALVLLINKIDLASSAQVARIESDIRDVYPTLSPVPVGRLSVLKKKGVDEAMALVDHAFASHNRRLTTPQVNRVLAEAARRREPPVIGRGRAKLFYGTQTGVRPPTIGIFTNRVELPEEYIRFLERCFREEIDFEGSPLRLRFVRRDSHSNRDPGEAPPRSDKTGRDRRGLKSRTAPVPHKSEKKAARKAAKTAAKTPAKSPGTKPSKPGGKPPAGKGGKSAGKTPGRRSSGR